ncbi:efflux RND transporter periplasmic adaptor subunit [Sandarakinorhabdus sp.]|uniref:efflux RND transporter periplasmic adaptor subunit n=1 Tax=Sandarakinorhabdus sp. TaxID=1916663 RepID=UPI00286EA4BB|nr:efflux RND transporter periplasmic adaptor subunit [Sandarakinorhabdus sp.]
MSFNTLRFGAMPGSALAHAALALLPMALLVACSDPAPPRATPVGVIAVALGSAVPADGTGALVIAGTVRLKRETQLSFNTPGRVAAIAVREGDRVARGQLLARLDATGLDAALASARAEAVRADADLARAKGLFDKGWVTAPRVEAARASAAAARARVRQAGFDVGLATLRAPTAGVVLSRAAEPGQIVKPGQLVLSVGEYDAGYVLRLPMADSDAARLRLGQPAQVRLPALGPAPMNATVSEIGARGDEGTGTFRVELKLPVDPRLKSGLIGTAMLTLPGAASVASPVSGPVSVPASAVFGARADEGFVYVHDAASGRVKLRQVAVGPISDTAVIVTGGLKPGEKVAISGVDRLRDGSRVNVRPSAGPLG